MFRSTIGAQRASSRNPRTAAARQAPILGYRRLGRSARILPTGRWIGLALTGSLVLGLALAPAAGASAPTLQPALDSSTVALATTVVDKPWYTVERFSLGLINCDRTGGWILADGTCRGYGSGHYSAYVPPIAYSIGLSDKVSRPYSKLLVTRAICSHTAYGDPGYRLRLAGYMLWNWGENIGCRDGYASAKAAVLASQLAFQAERSANGGHWRNIKNARYRSIGIGVWRYGSRTRLVLDFYG